MCSLRNSQYFKQRMQECVSAAGRATDPCVARVHRNFAEHYRAAAEQPTRDEAIRPEASAKPETSWARVG